MLFQSYIGCRPAELIHTLRGRDLEDPLKGKDTYPDIEEAAFDDESDNSNNNNNSSYASIIEDGSRDIIHDVIAYKDSDFIGDFISDSDDKDNFEYNSDKIDNIMTENTADCYISKVNDLGALI